MCACSRVNLEDRTPAILVLATELVGAGLPLAERVRRLGVGIDAPIAFFSGGGDLMDATPDAEARLLGLKSLAALGADTLAGEALVAGRASGTSHLGPITTRTHRLRRLDRAAGELSASGASPGGRASCGLDTRARERTIRTGRDRPRAPAAGYADASGRAAAGRAATAAQQDARRAPPIAALRLADGCRRPPDDRHRGIRHRDRAASRRHAEPPLARDRDRSQPRYQRSDRARHRVARHLEQHHSRLPGRRRRAAPAGRTVGPSGVRSRAQPARLPRLRRLPRCRNARHHGR